MSVEPGALPERVLEPDALRERVLEPGALPERVLEPGALPERVLEPGALPERVLETALRRRRFALFLLPAGIAIATALLSRHWPHDHEVEFAVPRRETLLGIDVSWTESTNTNEVVQTTAWHFNPGAAPRSIVHLVRLPSGLYDVEIVVRRVDAIESIHRRIELDDSERIRVALD